MVKRFVVVLLFLFNTLLAAGQDWNKKSVTYLDTATMSLAEFLKDVQRQSGCYFMFAGNWADDYPKLSIPAGVFSVRSILAQILPKTCAEIMKEEGKQIFLYKARSTYLLHGKVVDAISGEPLVGAILVNRQSQHVYYTVEDGTFFVEADKDDQISISYSGTLPVRLRAKHNFPSIITLQPVNLNEVEIPDHYLPLKYKNVLGAISTVSLHELARKGELPAMNALQVLQGRTTGLFMEGLSGVPGSGYDLRIRGRNTFREEGNEPLIIINGVPYPTHPIASDLTSGQIAPRPSVLNTIAPSSIETIQVLKDAEATAIYGIMGANGVIRITTHSPAHREGVEINFSRGIRSVDQRFELLNSKQWLTLRKEAFANDQATMTSLNARDLTLWDTTRYTDWQKELVGGAAPVTNLVINTYAGNKAIRFFAGAALYKEGTVFPGSFDYRRYNVNLGLNHTTSRLIFDFKFNYSGDQNKLPFIDLTGPAIAQPPVAPSLLTSIGEMNWEKNTWLNPLANIYRTYEANTTNITSHASAQLMILPGLTVKLLLGQATLVSEEIALQGMHSLPPIQIIDGSATGSHTLARYQWKSLQAEPQIEYIHKIAEGTLLAQVGGIVLRTVYEGGVQLGTGYPSDASLKDLSSAPVTTSIGNIRERYGYAGMFIHMNYDWRSRYIINITARRDGSSRYSPGRRFGNFGAIGAAWVFTKEPFSDNLPFSFGKLKASYGITGSDQMGDVSYRAAYERVSDLYDSLGITPSRGANPNVSWEKNYKLDVGLSLAFFNNHLQADITWYRNRLKGPLGMQTISVVGGFPSLLVNLPATVQNSGIEVDLSATPLQREQFIWKLSLNVTLPKNKLLRYDGLDYSPDSGLYVIGESIDIVRRYQTHIDPQSGKFLYTDRNGNGRMDEGDRYSIPVGVRSYGGIENTLRYGSFSLAILCQFVNQTRSSYVDFLPQPGQSISNQPLEVMSRWRKPGDLTNVHRFTQNQEGFTEYLEGKLKGDVSITDASYWRLKNVTFSYVMPTKIVQKLFVRECRAYIQAQNLITITRYIGVDPETRSTSHLPPLRSIIIGTFLTF